MREYKEEEGEGTKGLMEIGELDSACLSRKKARIDENGQMAKYGLGRSRCVKTPQYPP